MSRGTLLNNSHSPETSAIEGHSLGELEKTWEDLAASEARIRMMDKLAAFKVGFNDVENFNLGLIFNSKTINNDEHREGGGKKVVEVAMKFKRKDEIRNRKRLIKEKIKLRRKIETELKLTNNKKKKMMTHLNKIAENKKSELEEKYRKKIDHLRMKYEVDKNRDMDRVPQEMEEYGDAAVFSERKFEELESTTIKVVKYGEVELDEEEEEAMKLHPKMAMPRRLEEGYLAAAMDTSYTKVRWQLRKEEENEKGGGEEDKTRDKKRKQEEENEIEEARTRLVYDS